ncbi:hypothetical protein Vqi01_06690 [Micromonospora qiuiae]|uniref:Uncharacterized protein n=1 Tax=Micromonospora qiuiae TaxID=502268 RepID=A0ABQ4J5S3_9ACTN|nr:hypothetical protein Vqi01_06690 [Micromonospora qiuiae]
MGAGVGGPAGPGMDQFGVAAEVTDAGVDLAQGETQGGHVLILPQRGEVDTWAPAHLPPRYRRATARGATAAIRVTSA